jgi:hypothetical protein
MIVARAVAFVLAVTAICGCDRSPAGPSPAGGPSPSAPIVTGLRIDGPTSVAPGESPRYAAIAEYSDGSSKDVTATASWFPAARTGFPICFTDPGVAAPAERGEVTIVANASGRMARLNVLVLEPGTFKLSGPVSEAGVGALYGATVEVLSGIGQGLHATSNSNGYALYGVSGPLRLRASADGFTPQIHEVVVTKNDAADSFALTPVDAPADVSGVWTMTVSPAPSCPAGLPDIARGRIYEVKLIQQGTHLQVRTSSPTLEVFNPNENYGSIFGSRVRLQFVGDTDYGEWSTPDLYDHLSATETFGFDGVADGTVTGSEIRAAMNGDLVYWNARTFAPAWYCRATNHNVILRR